MLHAKSEMSSGNYVFGARRAGPGVGSTAAPVQIRGGFKRATTLVGGPVTLSLAGSAPNAAQAAGAVQSVVPEKSTTCLATDFCALRPWTGGGLASGFKSARSMARPGTSVTAQSTTMAPFAAYGGNGAAAAAAAASGPTEAVPTHNDSSDSSAEVAAGAGSASQDAPGEAATAEMSEDSHGVYVCARAPLLLLMVAVPQ